MAGAASPCPRGVDNWSESELGRALCTGLWSQGQGHTADKSNSKGLDDPVSSPAESVQVEPASLPSFLGPQTKKLHGAYGVLGEGSNLFPATASPIIGTSIPWFSEGNGHGGASGCFVCSTVLTSLITEPIYPLPSSHHCGCPAGRLPTSSLPPSLS